MNSGNLLTKEVIRMQSKEFASVSLALFCVCGRDEEEYKQVTTQHNTTERREKKIKTIFQIISA